MYSRNELENMAVRGQGSLREMAMKICRDNNLASSWVQTSTKGDLVDWIYDNMPSSDNAVTTESVENVSANSENESGNSAESTEGTEGESSEGELTEEQLAELASKLAESESTSSEGDGDGENEGASSESEELPKMQIPNYDEFQFVTSTGLTDISNARKNLGIEHIVEGLNASIEHNAKERKSLDIKYGIGLKLLEEKIQNSTSNASGATELNIVINGAEPTKIKEHTHPKFKDVLFDLSLENQALIIGEAGTGKTTMGEQLAKALNVRFASISCSEGMAEAHLLGRMLFNGEYVKSDFVDCYENGGLFLMDELDASDANTLLVLNSALANGHISVPNRRENPTAKRHENFYFLGAMNTYGTDNGNFQYVGRNKLDGAFMDRFAQEKHVVTYDKKLEKSFCVATYNFKGTEVDLGSNGGNELYEILSELRKRLQADKSLNILSTRLFAKLPKKYVALGGGSANFKKCLKQFMLGWDKQSIARLDIDGLLANYKLESINA